MKINRKRLQQIIKEELCEAGYPSGHPADPSAGHLNVSSRALASMAKSLASGLMTLGYEDLADLAFEIKFALDSESDLESGLDS